MLTVDILHSVHGLVATVSVVDDCDRPCVRQDIQFAENNSTGQTITDFFFVGPEVTLGMFDTAIEQLGFARIDCLGL